MIEGLFILALLALVLVWVDSKAKDKTIERLNYMERHRTGNLNEDDKREIQYLRDSFHFRTIYREVKEDDMKNLDGYFDEEFVLKRQNRILKKNMDMNLNQKKTLFFERNHIVFEFSVIDNLPYNFIHPEAMFYWIIEPPTVLNWNEPFNFTLSPEGSKPSFPCKGIERLSRELVKCSDGVFRTCAKIKIEVICNNKQYDVDFYVDKTLQHTGTIGSDLGNRIKRNE